MKGHCGHANANISQLFCVLFIYNKLKPLTFFRDGVGVSNLAVFETGILFDVRICTDNTSLDVTTSKEEIQ